MMKKKKIKNLKPKEYNIHLKYICRCSQEHWLSYDEASEEDFVIVCECKRLLKVKPISGIIVKYKINKKAKKIVPEKNNTNDNLQELKTLDNKDIKENTINSNNTEINKEIPENLINTCSNLLITFGYSKREAANLIKDFYSKNSNIDYSKFVKNLLISIGESK